MFLRTVDLSASAVDSGSITAGAESVKTTVGGGTVATVAGIGQRLAVGAASGDSALLRTAEKIRGAAWAEASITGLLGGTLTGRTVEIGFRNADQAAVFRVVDGVLYIVVKVSASVEQALRIDATSLSISLERTHEWRVRINRRQHVVFSVDGEEVGELAATTAVLAEDFAMWAAAVITNPGATSGTARLDVHAMTVEVDALPERLHHVTAGAVAQTGAAKAEAGFVTRARGVTAAAAARYLMLFDKATAPVNGDVPRARVGMAASAQGAWVEWADAPLRFALGIQIAFSTTADTLTLPAAEGLYEVDYF